MTDHIIQVKTSYDKKPKFGEPCNHCGWCCVTEVCTIGKELGGGEPPCNHLVDDGGKKLCGLANLPTIKEAMAMGVGCDAKTQAEVIKEHTDVKQ